MLTASEISEIFTILSKTIPNPVIELEYVTDYTLLVAVILSARATDKSVNRVTKKLFAVASTPEEMIELGIEGLKGYIRTIGLYNTKARNIIATSIMLLEEFGSKVPSSFEELCKLPGVGRKSANVILNVLYGQATFAVDTHVFRVCNRMGLCQAKTPIQTEMALLKLVPLEFAKEAHHLLVLHGRYTCIAKKPLCNRCPIKSICGYEKKTD